MCYTFGPDRDPITVLRLGESFDPERAVLPYRPGGFLDELSVNRQDEIHLFRGHVIVSVPC